MQCNAESGSLDMWYFSVHFLKILPGIQLHQSNNVDIKMGDNKASITLKAAHKEHEGVYTARLRMGDGIQEHSAFVYVKG